MVWSHVQGGNNVVAAADYLDWKQQNKTFQDLNAWSGANYNFATPSQPEQINGSAETPGFLRMTGNSFFLGRDFLPEEGQPGKDHEVVLMHRLWEHLGSDRNILGKTIQMNSEPYTVVGVLAAGQADRLDGQFVVPLAFKPDQINHDFHWLLVMGRMKPGVSLGQAQADMEVVTNRIAQDHPQSNKGWGISVEQLHNDFFPKEAKQTLWLLMGGVGFLLLIACGNVANLVLAKGHDAPEGSGRTHFAGRESVAGIQPVPDGESGIGCPRRRVGHWTGRGDDPDHDGEDASEHSAIRSGCDAESAGPVFYAVGHDRSPAFCLVVRRRGMPRASIRMKL